MYSILRNILFLFDAEKVHYFSMDFFRWLLKIPFLKPFFTRSFSPKDHPVSCCGIEFKNPVGLGAGFDKNASYLAELENLGFGFVEIGTVTQLPQSGNPKPRLFRLPDDKAIINRMGFNNDGADAIAERLKEWRKRDSRLVIGINIGKNKNTPNEEAWLDYEKCFLKLNAFADYMVVNVSSPNTPGLRDLQQNDSLRVILGNLVKLNNQLASPRPLFLKISPDTDKETIDEIVSLCMQIKLHGIIISNTTVTRSGLRSSASEIDNAGAGGLSGKPLNKISTDLVKFVHAKAGNSLTIIASGGIFTAEDAHEKLKAGATLVQVWTGFIYEGPAIVKKIVNGLPA